MKRQNEQGSALLLTIIITVILLFLGGSLGILAMVESRMTQREEASMRAYYLARSGADAMAQAILDDPTLLKDPIIKDGTESEPVAVGEGTFAVRVFTNVVPARVQSTGIVGDQQRSVVLTILSRSGPFDNAVVALGRGDGAITLGGGKPTVTGDIAVYEGTEIVGEHLLKGEIKTLSAEVQYPAIVFPEFPSLGDGDIDENNVIWANGHFDTLSNGNGETLVIDLKGNVNGGETRKITVGTLNLKGSLELRNVGETGQLLLYVENIASGSNLLLNGDSEETDKPHPRDLTLYYSGTTTFEMTNPNKQYITGNIVIGYADVEVDNEAADVGVTGGYLNGNLFTMGSYVKMSGNPDASASLIYAPNAEVEMTGGAFVGGVIADTFNAGGNSQIQFPDFADGEGFIDTFPEGIFGPNYDYEEGGGYRKGTWSAGR